MAIDQESFNTDLYRLLRTRGYKPVPKDAKNQRIQPEAAEVFHFTFNKDGKDYGDAWVTIDDAQKVILYYGNEQEESPSGKSPGLDYDDSWSGLKRHLKQWSMNKQLTFELRNKDELGDDMAQRDYVKKKEKMNEAYHPMGKTASYNDNIPAVKIILQHNRKIEEGEQRYRNIAKIFLENQDGERFLAPTTRPSIAQVYARHIAEGGVPNDERWNHVKALCEEYSKMAGFVRATKNKQFNESAQQLVSEGINHYQSLRETLGKLRGHRGYNQYFESWTPALMEDDTDNTINELFVQETVDPRIESVMPILARLNKNKATTTVKEVSELAEWADKIVEQGVAEGSCEVEEDLSSMMRKGVKKVKRAVSSWDGSAHLEDLKQYIKNAPDDLLLRLAKKANDNPDPHSPRELQIKLIDRELKRRYGLTPKGNIKPDSVEEDLSGMMRQGVKKVKRAINWSGMNDPNSIRKAIRGFTDKELRDSYSSTLLRLYEPPMPGDEEKWKGTPYGMAFKLMQQELKRRFLTIPKSNTKPDSVEEDLDADQKRVKQLGPTEKVGKKGTVGKLVGVSEAVAHDSPEESVIMNIVNGNIDPYQVMNHPKTDAERIVSGILQDMYDDVSTEHRLYDDDSEEILNIVVDRLADEYDPYPMSESINENAQDSVANALYTRVTRVRTDLLNKYGIGAINDAIDEISSRFAGEELDEIGSSDVSGWIREMEQILASSSSMNEGYRPGEINNGDQVQIKKDSPYYEPGTWTVSQCTDGGKCWIGDEDDRGWYIRTSELELADSMGFGDDDDFDPDFVYGKSEPEDDVDGNDFGDFGDDPRDTDPLDEIKRLIK